MFRILAFAALISLPFAAPLYADKPVFLKQEGVAIGGFDPVAYFKDAQATPGSASYQLMWKGVIWQFASQDNLDAFEANPWAYAPQFGGYCAFAVAQGFTLGVDPYAWDVIDGKLYLMHDDDVLDRWLANLDGNLESGLSNWPAVLSE